MQISDRQFDAIVQAAIGQLPEQFRAALDDVRVERRDRPTPEMLQRLGMAEDELLLGLYEGVPLTERSVLDGPRPPDVIYLFKEDLKDACEDEQQLAEEIEVTLRHELGHYFGFDEDGLDELGYA